MSITPTGTVQQVDGKTRLVLQRTFQAPIQDVWDAVTEPERMARWIGTWSGDPASGQVDFFMTAEAEDAPASPCKILECKEPERLHVQLSDDAGGWNLLLELSEQQGITTLTFTQLLESIEGVGDIGPGWEYYLDRLVTAHGGGDVSAVNWDDYFPAQQAYYQAAAG